VADSIMVEAIAAAKERRSASFPTSWNTNVADARRSRSQPHRNSAPLLDLDAIEPDLETVRIVSEKMLRKHRVCRWSSVGRTVPSDFRSHELHALDEVKFATGFPSKPSSSKETSLANC